MTEKSTAQEKSVGHDKEDAVQSLKVFAGRVTELNAQLGKPMNDWEIERKAKDGP